MAPLNRSELAIWFILYRDVWDGTARTAVTDLARRGGMDRRTVLRALRRLHDQGFIHTVAKGGLNAEPSRYRVFPRPSRGHKAPRAASCSAGE
jgi:hypothetical protein